MKIPPAHARLAQATDGAAGRHAAPATLSDSRVHASRLDRVDLTERNGSASDRVSAFADRIHERLANLASGAEGADAARVAAASERFGEHVQRIQDALAAGTLDRAGLKQALSNTLDLLREELATPETRELPRGDDPGTRIGVGTVKLERVEPPVVVDEGPPEIVVDEIMPGGDARQSAERVEALAAKIEERLAGLSERLGSEADRALEATLGQFQQNIGRILDGLAGGSLSGDDLERAVQSTLDRLRQDVQASISPEEPEVVLDGGPGVDGRTGGVADGATPAEERIAAFTESVEDRFANLAQSGMSDAALASLREVHSEFSSSVERLQDAFRSGSIDRHEFAGLFRSAIADMRDELSTLFGADEPDQVGLYNPVTGVEQLDRIGPAGVDATA